MIEVRIADEHGELGLIKIEKLQDFKDDTADYGVRFIVDRARATGAHQRGLFRFPRTKVNVLGLLLAALNTLEEEELSLEDGTEAGDLARRERDSMPALPGEKKHRRGHYGPSFWNF